MNPRDQLLDRRRKIVLAAVLLAGLVIIARNILAADEPTSDTGPQLVAYLVKWHATARASSGVKEEALANGGYHRVSESHVAEMSGSAIVRFQDCAGRLCAHDTRYLAVTLREDEERWDTFHDAYTECTKQISRVVADQGSYSGLYVPFNSYNRFGLLGHMREKRDDGITVIPYAFDGLSWAMALDGHFTNVGLGPGQNCQGVLVSRDIKDSSFLMGTANRRELVLQATNPKDDSYFFLKIRFTADGPAGTNTVEWTAEARLLGKCAERTAPIPDGDPVIENEDVHIDSDDSEIQPDGSTKVHVKVTCDQVPIKDAEVELTSKPQDSSGGHMHTEKRPHGKLKDTELTEEKPSITEKTDANGKVTVKFDPPGKTPSSKNVGLAGVYEVKATSKRFPDRTDTVPISVAFRNVTSFVESPDAYYEVSAPQHGRHSDGTFGTAGTLSAFQSLARDFYQTQERHNDQLKKCNKPPWNLHKVSFNDIALPTGGLFDHQGTWAPPHQTHGKGQGGDLNHFYESGKVTECNGSKVNFDDWLTAMLLELGSQYGHWDQWDLDQPQHFLHLHVED